LITAELERACKALPDAIDRDPIRCFQEHRDHNELELACDRLELYANEHGANREFWLCLAEAAKKIELSENAERYEEQARIAQH
jgi:hypothetical protein